MATHTTFNHPPGDLCDGDYIRAVPLYRALAKGDLKSAKDILQRHEYLVRSSITEYKETPLHVAIMSQRTKIVSYLVDRMSKTDLELQNRDGNTAFCLAAISGNVDMAEIMVNKNPALPMICGAENTMPLCLAAFHGKHEMVDFLYLQSKRMKADGWTSKHRNEVLLKCIEANMFDFAMRILRDNKELPDQDIRLWDVLRILAEKPEAFLETTSWAFTGVMTRPAILLLRLVLQRVTEKLKDIEKDQMETYPSQILFIAARMNNKQFLIELIREYPDLIWQRNDNGQTIFHVAVAHRHNDVYDLLHDIGSMKDFITPIADKDGNNVLHLAAKIPEDISYKDAETTPYEILSEYFWYQVVESTVPPPCRHVKNTNGLTPKELFIESHREAHINGMDRIQETINQSMMVAAIVCTVGFSIVYSIPGGFDNSGFPIFDGSKSFIWFIILGTASFILSGSSIVISLSIILARGVQPNETLVERWIIAQATFIASLCTIVAAFISGFFLLYPNSKLPYIISVVCIVQFGIYIKLYKSVLRLWLFQTIFRTFRVFLRVIDH